MKSEREAWDASENEGLRQARAERDEALARAEAAEQSLKALREAAEKALAYLGNGSAWADLEQALAASGKGSG